MKRFLVVCVVALCFLPLCLCAEFSQFIRNERVLTVNNTTTPFSLYWSLPDLCNDFQLWKLDAGHISNKQLGNNIVLTVDSSNHVITTTRGGSPGPWVRSSNTIYTPDGDDRNVLSSDDENNVIVKNSFDYAENTPINQQPEVPCSAICAVYGDPHIMRFDKKYEPVMIAGDIPLATCKDLKVIGNHRDCFRAGITCSSGFTAKYLSTTVSVEGSLTTTTPTLRINNVIKTMLPNEVYTVPGTSVTVKRIHTENYFLVTTPHGMVQYTQQVNSGAAVTGATVKIHCNVQPSTGTNAANVGLCGMTTTPNVSRSVRDDIPAPALEYFRQFCDRGLETSYFGPCGVSNVVHAACVFDIFTIQNVQIVASIFDLYVMFCHESLMYSVLSPVLSHVIPLTTTTFIIGTPFTINIRAVDANGITLPFDYFFFDGDGFAVTVGSSFPVPAALSTSAGLYSAIVAAPLRPGKYNITVKVYGFFDIYGSPTTITVIEPPPIPLLCVATMTGLIPILSSNLPRVIVISTLYAPGIPRTTGGELVTVSVSTGTVGPVIDNNDGTYTVTYTRPWSLLGIITISIKVNGEHIFLSPYTVISLLS